MKETNKSSNKCDLGRFIEAQIYTYDDVISELTFGQKQGHWMWFIFPQIEGLGHSDKAKYYAIKNREETRQYLDHSILGERLVKCTELVFDIEGRSVLEIFGSPDDRKFKSSMTLFSYVEKSSSIFDRVLDKYFYGDRDENTLNLLKQ